MKTKIIILALISAFMLIPCAIPINAQASKMKKASPPKTKAISKPPDNLSVSVDSTKKTKPVPKYDKSVTKKSEYARQAYLKISAIRRGDSVVLRWAVTTPGGWVTANKAGYVVERLEVGSDNPSENLKISLTPEPLKPWTLEQWKAKSSRNDSYAAIAAQCLYGKIASKDFNSSASEAEFSTNLRNAATELSNRHGFALFVADLNAHAAEGLGLRLVDKDIKPGISYIYRVGVAVQDTTYYISEAITSVGSKQNDPVPPPPANLKVIEGEQKIRIEWDNREVDAFTAFNMYRSDGDGKNFIKLNKTPIVPMESFGEKNVKDNADKNIAGHYIDTNVVNYHQYTYCLKGISSFAEESMCAEIKGMPRDKTPPNPPRAKSEQIGTNSVRIHWTIDKPEGDLAGFYVSKSNDFEANFIRLHNDMLDKNVREFVDNEADEDQPYYLVTAVDTAGNRSKAIPFAAMIIDSLPPSQPTGFMGRIDSNGIVNLWWDLAPESSVVGYRIFWANDSTHEFTQITPGVVEDTTYTDTVSIKTLSRYVYYNICAVNRRYMPSQMSDMLEIERPDIYPPVPAVFTNFSVSDSSINLKWEYSRSNDVVKQALLRRPAGSADWEILSDLPIDQDYYTDIDLADNTLYEYAVETTDAGGLKSITESFIQARSPQRVSRINLDGLKAEYDEKSGCININWSKAQFPSQANNYYAIYRGYSTNDPRGGEPQIYQSIDPAQNELTDKMLTGKGFYRYAVKIMSSGRELGMKEVVVEVR